MVKDIIKRLKGIGSEIESLDDSTYDENVRGLIEYARFSVEESILALKQIDCVVKEVYDEQAKSDRVSTTDKRD